MTDTTLGTTIANLGMDDVKFPAPVHIGDTLRSETTVIEKRDSKSRPDAGIVVFEHKSFNQGGHAGRPLQALGLNEARPA
ncbi:MAG: MaoC/PaaZ C-terminal domain-containing protein [Aliidongia sp.]